MPRLAASHLTPRPTYVDPEPLTPEEDYAFDVGGFLVVPGVLTAVQVDACNKAIDAGALDGQPDRSDLPKDLACLQDHPVLGRYLDQLTFDGYYVDRTVHLVDPTDSPTLSGGNEPRQSARTYHHQNEVRFAQGIIAIWALTDVEEGDGGFALVPASHKSSVETPSDLLDGTDDMDLVLQLPLRAGDLLLCVESVLHGVKPWRLTASRRLVALTFAAEQAQRLDREKDPPPKWVDELTPEQRAVVAPLGRPEAPPVLEPDEASCRLREPGVFHPTIYVHNPESGIDENEFYFWDLCGHLVLRDVMDEAWLSAANEAIDHFSDRIEVGGDAAKGSNILAGTGIPTLQDPFGLPKPYCEPFRRMLAHPTVVHRLNWMMGSGFRTRGGRVICSVKGTSGHGLHSGAEPVTPIRTYFLQNGRSYAEGINVAWQLHDVTEADGGFVCLPGSHKARYPITPSMIACEETLGLVRHVEMKAGDVVMFLSAAQTHGAYPWRSDVDRRAVLLGYLSRNIA